MTDFLLVTCRYYKLLTIWRRLLKLLIIMCKEVQLQLEICLGGEFVLIFLYSISSHIVSPPDSFFKF